MKQLIKLSTLLNETELKIITKLASGSSVIMLVGGDSSTKSAIYKNIRRIMVEPVYNGVCIYDAARLVHSQCDRDVITVHLNKITDRNLIHAVRQQGGNRAVSIYKEVLK